MKIHELEREVTRLSKLVLIQAEKIKELEKHSHPPVDFDPMLKRLDAIEAKMKEWQLWNGLR